MVDPRAPRPLRPSRRSAAALLLLALAGAAASACADEQVAPKPPPVPVLVAEARRELAPLAIAATGTVESRSTVAVSARVGGEIVAVHFREGDDVEKGQLLFSIDPRPFQTALAEAEARLERDRVLAENAAREAARYEELVAKDFVTREQYDRAQAEARALRAGLAADEAAVADARLQLEYASIRAPITGRAGAVLVHPGNNVRPNDQPLVVLHQMEPVDVRFPVPQRDLAEVRRRAATGELTVVAREQGGEEKVGRLTFVDNAVDAATGTIQLKATFANEDRALWPGQLVEISLQLGEEEAVVAPEAAIQSGQQGDFVFVVEDDGTVESRPVRVERSFGGRVVIAEGLEGGETVVTDGQLRLVPGAQVVIRTPGEAAPATSAAATTGKERS